MLNSILDRKLDRLHYEDTSTNQKLFTNDSKIIENECIQHFQLLGKTREEIDNTSKIASILINRNLITPIDNIHHQQMATSVNPITTDEILLTLSTIPNKKAAGPSGITYEDLKHLDDRVIEMICYLFNKCLELNIVPKDWQEALLFPISKPKEWDCEINQTRPIVLKPQENYC